MKRILGILSLAIFYITSLASSESTPPVKTSKLPVDKKDPRECDCFTVSGADPGYFQHYKLWDFRAVPLKKTEEQHPPEQDDDSDEWDEWGEGEDIDEDEDEDEEDHEYEEEAFPGSLYFFKTTFDKDWISQKWHRPRTPLAPVTMVNSKRNVFFTKAQDRKDPKATYLVLRTTRHNNFTSTAEIETRVRNIFRCSLRVHMRILPISTVVLQPPHSQEWPSLDPNHHAIAALNDGPNFGNSTSALADASRPPSGACVGIFTYHAKNCESDIEILTSDPSHRVRYANQPDYDPLTDQMIPGAATVADLPVPWTGWTTQRLDWHSDRSRWYVNNQLQEAKTYRVPNLQSRLVINLWSDGGVWTGDMKIGDSIYLAIEYIELAYNRSSDGNERGKIPPEENHGGHQRPRPRPNTTEIGIEDVFEDEERFEPETEILTGAWKKKKKHNRCKKGKKGKKCREKKKKEKQKHGKGGGGGHSTGPKCQRMCNIDELHFGSVD
ncbi:Endo-1-3(4)-beta-glucanase [Penicillium angulare]|uniref:Endo-1-3(4)-beta-glucanase n=1 Tax=Penicillium angulare TaxID=116970 RepID=A0A9W9FUW6_9EURO|nr:Endo-1-3(4)-beta-glucanase [Penicillium angulare]